MNNKTDILKRIKALMFGSQEAAELKFLDIQVDGTDIRIEGEDIVVDAKVSKVDGEEVSTLADGTYIYDSKEFTVVDGVITEVKDVEVEVETETETEDPTTAEEEFETETEDEPKKSEFDWVSKYETLINRVTIFEEQIAQVNTNYQNFAKIFEDYLSDTPADTNTKTKNFKKQIADNKSNASDALDALRNIRTKK